MTNHTAIGIDAHQNLRYDEFLQLLTVPATDTTTALTAAAHVPLQKLRVAVVSLIVGLICSSTHAATYRCEASGNVVYQDSPCPQSAQSRPVPAATATGTSANSLLDNQVRTRYYDVQGETYAELSNALRQNGSQPCERLEQRTQETYNQVYRALIDRDREYDHRTGHGASQGALF